MRNRSLLVCAMDRTKWIRQDLLRKDLQGATIPRSMEGSYIVITFSKGWKLSVTVPMNKLFNYPDLYAEGIFYGNSDIVQRDYPDTVREFKSCDELVKEIRRLVRLAAEE